MLPRQRSAHRGDLCELGPHPPPSQASSTGISKPRAWQSASPCPAPWAACGQAPHPSAGLYPLGCSAHCLQSAGQTKCPSRFFMNLQVSESAVNANMKKNEPRRFAVVPPRGTPTRQQYRRSRAEGQQGLATAPHQAAAGRTGSSSRAAGVWGQRETGNKLTALPAHWPAPLPSSGCFIGG